MSRPIFAADGSLVFALSKGPPTVRAKRTTPEADFQRELVAALGYALPEPYAFHASMVGTNVGKWKGDQLRALGVRPDWSDLIIVNLDTGAARFMELKSPVGSMSAGQRTMAARLGDKWATVRTLNQAQAALLGWRILLRMPLAFANRYQAPMWSRMSQADQLAAWSR